MPCKKATASSRRDSAERRMAALQDGESGESIPCLRCLNGNEKVDEKSNDTEQYGADKYDGVKALEVQFAAFAASPAFMIAVATCLHRCTQYRCPFEAADKEWHHQGRNLHGALDKVALVEAHTACRLRLHQTLNLSDEDWHKFKGNHHHHHQGADGNADALQRCKERFGAIGQVYQRGCEGEH